MENHMEHLQQLKDFDENLAYEKEARAHEMQEKKRLEVQKAPTKTIDINDNADDFDNGNDENDDDDDDNDDHEDDNGDGDNDDDDDDVNDDNDDDDDDDDDDDGTYFIIIHPQKLYPLMPPLIRSFQMYIQTYNIVMCWQ